MRKIMEQQENLTTKLINNLPNNLLLVGPKYSGKKTLINEIAPDFYWVEGSVDAIRELQSSNLIFADIDKDGGCFLNLKFANIIRRK